ncbi:MULTISPECIES: alpha/beta fold hydrolase [unclassified Sphingomonas]|uniref:alpha/beta fold hydrolase n=1 Tax=unclassified Sphingomonas TaxID=196159 RepID=UPI0006FCD001|nr:MULTISPECIES: alpha/beta hydrolase [unclassified Sphingomonas]KQM61683.1 alpha/beta hydrolase [Sphingomonas sp. Leaf16]KQN12956.1 alpha/beta hydrolase [Sphingomonas sp. Leaf29]KQN19843.1 alpha/beta hydrolase [Sphingomonas sp. Leaf32]
MTPLTRIALSTGVSLDVAVAGKRTRPAMIFLHGFPESHRTWRHQLSEFARDHYVVAPDQRGYAGSDKPPAVADYAPAKPVADLIALADALDIDRFTLVGHDWGGAIAWMAALNHPDRIERLVILNAPHPLIFQRSLFDDPDQRAASQYMTRFRDTALDQGLVGAGLERFFATGFAKFVTRTIAGEDKAAYLTEWANPGAMTAMLNWYRASSIVVPAPGETPARPAWLDAPFPPVTQPTLVIWGTQDQALLPVQLAGLGEYVPVLTVVEVEAGHFVPWEAPEAVNRAIRGWLTTHPEASTVCAG